jgi:hypothetical protein
LLGSHGLTFPRAVTPRRSRARRAGVPSARIAGAVEVLDTDGGHWLVVCDGPRVELWPVSPTPVFRGPSRLFPLTSELRGEPTR